MTIRYRVTGYGLRVMGYWFMAAGWNRQKGGNGGSRRFVGKKGNALEVESWKLDVGLFDECSCQVNKWTDG